MNLNSGYNRRPKNKNLINGFIPIPPHNKLPVLGSTVVIPELEFHHINTRVKNERTYIRISRVEIVECIDAAYKVAINSSPKTMGIMAVASLFIVGLVKSYHNRASSH